MIYFIEVTLAFSIFYDFIPFIAASGQGGSSVSTLFRPGHPEVQRSGHLATLRYLPKSYLNAMSSIVNTTVNGKCLQRSY